MDPALWQPSLVRGYLPVVRIRRPLRNPGNLYQVAIARAEKAPGEPCMNTKEYQAIAMLCRLEGATVQQLMDAFSWQK